MLLVTALDLPASWLFNVVPLLEDIDQDPSLLEEGVARSLPRERGAAAATPHPVEEGNSLLTVLLQCVMAVRIAVEIVLVPIRDPRMGGLFVVTSRGGLVPEVMHADIHTGKLHVPQAQRRLKGGQCHPCRKNPSFVSTSRVVSAREISACTSMKNLQLQLRCLLRPLRAVLRDGQTVQLLFLTIFERGVPQPSVSLGNDLWS